ncbi:DegT/DnrJ/EryC1/StrS family aminotransferase [Sulfitobacter guttiformis]|uniref:dTDP-4-amino-4,6-dideoxygalactose transaminase n=1 Tax=Sulfitobacter guttiformis TaxID=74349 RepID=A0A420DHI0_9RHOB|nr:aminotransferase class I/II-fold pyridoxal phosphate-dependent enzyme [Sulfitobacter guttiformis]KIN72584.1 Aminotransferase, DegT/DnrJ/EryC1/StrS family protein [Sulfitobacter guttiformis KCTC 32187]RKE93674.1 dTDP-4-amino-4,6-dideoxygalactose transaminase [Sulfitobacter guttiformis]
MLKLPNLTAAEPIPDAAQAEVDRILRTGDLFRYGSDQSPVALLEAEFAQALGTKFALAVSSCSAALFLSLKSLGLPREAKVLIPAFTFAAVPSAVVHADCIPMLCECGDDYRIDLTDFETKLPNCSAVIISHMRGHTSDMDAIMGLCDAAGVPVIEDAAHSLGTTWAGRNIGTIGAIGCFSFQSYKMLNAGEGGIMITDDEDLIAQAIIMSGAYEHNWQKHPVLHTAFANWQNKLPLYNLRLNTLSAALIRPQLEALPGRVEAGRRNHDHVAATLADCPWISVPASLPSEKRAPDSIQFNLINMSDEQVDEFVSQAASLGLKIQIFGRSDDNARAFWNWKFLSSNPDQPKTRAMLNRACDVRLPARLTLQDCNAVSQAILNAVNTTMRRNSEDLNTGYS